MRGPNDPQLRAAGFWRRAERHLIGTHVVPLAPYGLDGNPPPLGEHNAQVPGGELGLDGAELARLEKSGRDRHAPRGADVGADVGPDAAIALIEANARLQVEYTVAKEITSLDLVRVQLEIAEGARLADLRLCQAEVPVPRGIALEARVNLETIGPDGGVLAAYEPPSGRGERVDGCGYAG